MKFGLSAATIGVSLLMIQASHAAEIKAFVTGAAHRAYETLAPQFERATGHKLVTQFDLPPALIKRIDAGEPYDVIMLSYDVEALIKQGMLVRRFTDRVRPGRRRRRRPQGRTEAGLQHGRGVQAFAAQRQDDRDLRRRQQRALRRLACSTGSASPTRSSRRSDRARAAPRRNWCRAAKSISWCRGCRH